MRFFDIICAVTAFLVLWPLLVIIALLVRLTSKGPALHWSSRVGQNNVLFEMPKFRTMKVGAPLLATHEFSGIEQWLTPIGSFLRRTSIDELPQIWSILVGHMAVVGPRPALHNQSDLIALRTLAGVHEMRPGLTGWAQVNGRDELPIEAKAALDVEYLHRRSLTFDVKILFLTALKVFLGRNVAH